MTGTAFAILASFQTFKCLTSASSCFVAFPTIEKLNQFLPQNPTSENTTHHSASETSWQSRWICQSHLEVTWVGRNLCVQTSIGQNYVRTWVNLDLALDDSGMGKMRNWSSECFHMVAHAGCSCANERASNIRCTTL